MEGRLARIDAKIFSARRARAARLLSPILAGPLLDRQASRAASHPPRHVAGHEHLSTGTIAARSPGTCALDHGWFGGSCPTFLAAPARPVDDLPKYKTGRALVRRFHAHHARNRPSLAHLDVRASIGAGSITYGGITSNFSRLGFKVGGTFVLAPPVYPCCFCG